MEGMTYLEHPAPAVYLDSWLVRGASYPRPHVNWEVWNSKPSVYNVTIVKMVDTDASDDVNTHLPDKGTPMSTPMTAPAWPCVDSPRLPTVKHEIINRMKDTREIEMILPENAPPMIDPNMSIENSPEYVTPMSTPMTAPAWPCVDSPRLPTVKHEIINRMKDTREIEMILPEDAPPMIDPNMSIENSPEYMTPVSTPMTALAWPCVDSPRLPTVKHEIPPVHVPPADFKPVCSDADTKKCNHGEGIIRNKQSPLICSNHQHGCENSDRQLQDSMDITECYHTSLPPAGRRRLGAGELSAGGCSAGSGSEGGIKHDIK